MKKHLLPQQTKRQMAFEQWKESTMPMVTITKTFDVTALVNRQERFNALLTWCIAKAACNNPEFYLLPDKTGFILYDRLAVNIIVRCEDDVICPCDLPFLDLDEYLVEYDRLCEKVRLSKIPHEIPDEYMIIGTSALTETEIDSVTNAFACWWNPFFIWGKVREDGTLPISFQFHHAQMDGLQAVRFLNDLQLIIGSLARDCQNRETF